MCKRNGSFGERLTYLRSVLFYGVVFNVTQVCKGGKGPSPRK